VSSYSLVVSGCGEEQEAEGSILCVPINSGGRVRLENGMWESLMNVHLLHALLFPRLLTSV